MKEDVTSKNTCNESNALVFQRVKKTPFGLSDALAGRNFVEGSDQR